MRGKKRTPRRPRRAKAAPGLQAAFTLRLEKKGLKPRGPWKLDSKLLEAKATEWLNKNDPQHHADKRKRKRDDGKARKQAESNPALVARYAKAMHLI